MQSRCDQDAKGSLSGFIDPVWSLSYSQISYAFILLILGIFRRQTFRRTRSNMFVQPYVVQIRKLRKDCRLAAFRDVWVSTRITTGRLMLEPPVTQTWPICMEPSWILFCTGARCNFLDGWSERRGVLSVTCRMCKILKLWLMTSWWYVEFEDGRHVKQLAFRLSSGSTGVPKCIQIAHGGATVCCRYQSMEVNLWILVVQVILRMIMHGETSWCTPLCERFMQFRSRSPRSWRSAVLWLWLVRCSRKLLAPGPCGANPYCSYPAFASSLVVVVEHVDWIDYLANLISSKQSWFDVVLFISYWLGETMRLRPWHSTEIDCKLARRQHKTAWHNIWHIVYIVIWCDLFS